MNKATFVFEEEIGLIYNTCIREFVRQVFAQICPDYFWVIPASQRGHHPPICRTPGGLVHHVKLAVRFAESFAEMWHEQDHGNRDIVIAAVLLHDIFKRGEKEDCLYSFHSKSQACIAHGRYAANQIRRFLRRDEEVRHLVSEEISEKIILGVELHMGRWTENLQEDEKQDLRHDEVIRTVHLADYAASRSLHKWLGERYLDKSNEEPR